MTSQRIRIIFNLAIRFILISILITVILLQEDLTRDIIKTVFSAKKSLKIIKILNRYMLGPALAIIRS